jgi:hypothetical protein
MDFEYDCSRSEKLRWFSLSGDCVCAVRSLKAYVGCTNAMSTPCVCRRQRVEDSYLTVRHCAAEQRNSATGNALCYAIVYCTTEGHTRKAIGKPMK